jgi:hypothetical protein
LWHSHAVHTGCERLATHQFAATNPRGLACKNLKAEPKTRERGQVKLG